MIRLYVTTETISLYSDPPSTICQYVYHNIDFILQVESIIKTKVISCCIRASLRKVKYIIQGPSKYLVDLPRYLRGPMPNVPKVKAAKAKLVLELESRTPGNTKVREIVIMIQKRTEIVIKLDVVRWKIVTRHLPA